MSNLTLSQRIQRANAAVECEKVMAKHCYYHAGGVHREEYYEFWTKREDCTWAHNFGQMGDRFQYYENYVLNQERDTWGVFKSLWDVYPEVKKVTDYRALTEEAMHFLTTPIIEVADDGQSAKGLWYTPGCIFSTLNPQQALEGSWIWERYGADFILEDGEWKYLNLRVCCDVAGPMDCAPWAGEGSGGGFGPPPGDDGEEGDGPPPGGPGGGMTLKIPGPLHNNWSETQVPQTSPGIPEPYSTLSETFVYSDVKTLVE